MFSFYQNDSMESEKKTKHIKIKYTKKPDPLKNKKGAEIHYIQIT